MISPAPDPEAMDARLLAALEKRSRGEPLDEREVRICQLHDARQNCPSSPVLAGMQARETIEEEV